MNTVSNYALVAVKVLLTAAFLAAGTAKLLGVEMMVGTFEAIGWGQWFRYVTGAIEIVGAMLLWLPGRQALGAALLVVTMIGAVIAHVAVLGPSALPAAILGGLSAIVLYRHRNQIIAGQAT